MSDSFDPTTVALGKKLGVIDDPRTVTLERFQAAGVPFTAPTRWRIGARRHRVPVFANDRVGDCTFASTGDRIIVQEAAVGQSHETPLTDQDVLAGYSALTGYNPARPETDQ